MYSLVIIQFPHAKTRLPTYPDPKKGFDKVIYIKIKHVIIPCCSH